ncbi:MAG: hypothetical protein HY700_20605 [Gemmatimonadetes bacterium]|nr:hypothetical protein [Gemmatimonadota bacterium]
MKTISSFSLIAAAAVLGLSACNDGTSVAALLYSDSTVTADVANIAGDAIATSIETMAGNEDAAMPAPAALSPGSPSSLTVSRTRTCYDANGAVVAGCAPFSSVRKIVTHVTVSGDRSGTASTTGGRTATWSGAVHRVADDTVTRNFNTAQPPVEQSRTHVGLSVAHDTTQFANDSISRTHAEAARDSVKGVTWNLPRSSNPFPVSGSIVRVDSVHATFTKGSTTESRDVVRRVEVTFPADAQGNVVLKVNDKTCNLNLVTHVVSNCH